MIFANASLTISRKAGTVTSTVASGVSARIQPIGHGSADGDRPAAGFRFHVYVDRGVDVRLHDSLTGWNPRNLTPAPELVVEFVGLEDGPLGYQRVVAIDRRSREV